MGCYWCLYVAQVPTHVKALISYSILGHDALITAPEAPIPNVSTTIPLVTLSGENGNNILMISSILVELQGLEIKACF